MSETAAMIHRRFKLGLFLILCQVFGFAQGAYAGNCPDSLVGYWKLDENGSLNGKFLDQVNKPNGNDGLCDTDCPTRLDTNESAVAQGQLFDGSLDGISMAPSTDYDWGAEESFSIELWVKKSTTVTSGGEVLAARRDAATQLLWKVELKTNGTAAFTLISTGGQGASFTANGSKIINNNKWHHIVAMRDAASHVNAIYVDGELDGASAQITYTSGFGSADAGPTIGWIDAAGQERFSGSLDEVALYSRTLSDIEIAAHYYLSKGYCELYDSKIKILPLGDSITSGPPATTDSYRQSLWNAMAGDAYYMDFIGGESSGSGFDADNAGFGGITCSGLYSVINTGYNPDPSSDGKWPGDAALGPYLDYYPADVVLLHIGTNDLGTLVKPIATLVQEVEDTLVRIDQKSENITVVLAEIINRVGGSSNTTTFNFQINQMVQDRINTGDKIILLDMENGAGLSYVSGSPDFFDTLHPNAQGYGKMGAKWLSGLELFMPQFAAPVIQAATDPLVATIGRTFQFAVRSNGAPPPTFSLLASPDSNMTIGDTTGIVTWPAPQGPGPITITVQATNLIPTGTTTRSLTPATNTRDFEITLNNAPAAVSDNYDTASDGSLTRSAASGILANDSDIDLDTLTATLVSNVSHGTLTLNGDGAFTYASDGSGATTDIFTYQANDGHAASTTTTVTITITGSPNNSGGGGGGGGGCFIDASRAAAPILRGALAWLAALLLVLSAGLIHGTRDRAKTRPDGPLG